MYLGAMLSVSQAPVEPALERRRRTCPSWTAQHQRTAGSPAVRASARAGVVNRWPRRLQSQRHGGFAQESRARLSLRRRYPRRYRRESRSGGLLGAAGAGLQLLLGPGTSGVDVTFLFSVLDAGASCPRSTRGAPSTRLNPPCARPTSTPPAPRTDPAPSRRFAPPTRRLARLVSTSPPFAPVCAGTQCCPSTSTRVEGGTPRRRGSGGAARVGRGGA